MTASRHTYPLPSMEAARLRLRHLEKLIRGVDARLKLAQPSGVAGLESERGRLTAEFDALFAAVEILGEKLRHLPRCPCGKVSHSRIWYAERHKRAMELIDSDRGQHVVQVYRCEDGPEAVWHVGHDNYEPRRAAQGER